MIIQENTSDLVSETVVRNVLLLYFNLLVLVLRTLGRVEFCNLVCP